MIKKILIVLLLSLAGMPGVYADTDDFSTIERMGQLNGVALGCRYLEETRRIKKALIESLPKRRKYGKSFEDATNESFIDFTKTQATCPPINEFVADVDAAAKKLKKAFSSIPTQTTIQNKSLLSR